MEKASVFRQNILAIPGRWVTMNFVLGVRVVRSEKICKLVTRFFDQMNTINRRLRRPWTAGCSFPMGRPAVSLDKSLVVCFVG